MDTPADPATPLKEVYQAFFADWEKESIKQSTIDRYRSNVVRVDKALIARSRTWQFFWRVLGHRL